MTSSAVWPPCAGSAMGHWLKLPPLSSGIEARRTDCPPVCEPLMPVMALIRYAVPCAGMRGILERNGASV